MGRCWLFSNWDLQSLCSKWHSSPVFLTNTERCQDWGSDWPRRRLLCISWKWNPGITIESPGQGNCLYSGRKLNHLANYRRVLQSLLKFLALKQVLQAPSLSPEASKAARWFPWVSSTCTACSQSPKWGRGAAGRSVSKQSHTSTTIFREDAGSYFPLFLDLNVGLCICVMQ